MLVDEIIETEDFIIIGRDDINSNPKRKALTEIVQKICSDKPKILMDHNPVGIADGIQNNIDLVVCGHTHKGQFFLRIYLQNGLMESRDFTDILKRTRHTALFLRVLDISKCR